MKKWNYNFGASISSFIVLIIMAPMVVATDIPRVLISSQIDAVRISVDLKRGFGEERFYLTHSDVYALNSLETERIDLTIAGGFDHQLDFGTMTVTHDKLEDLTGRFISLLYAIPDIDNQSFNIVHKPFPPEFISDYPYTMKFDLLVCAEPGCSKKKRVSSEMELYVLSGADAETFKIPRFQVDSLFYINQSDQFRIAGFEQYFDIAEITSAVRNIELNELKSRANNAIDTLGDLLVGLDDVLTNDLLSVYDTNEQQQLFKDQNLLAFLASKEIDDVTEADLQLIAQASERHKAAIGALEGYLPALAISQEQTDCEGNIECKAYLHLKGSLNFEPELVNKVVNEDGEQSAEFVIEATKENPFKLNLSATLGANISLDKTWSPPRKQLLSKRLMQIYPTPVGVPVVLTQKFSLFAEVEVTGKLDAGAQVTFSYERDEAFIAGIGYNSKNYNLDGQSCTEALGDTNFKAYRCRATLKNSFKIEGKVDGEASANVTLWVYPEVEFMVYRSVGANLSIEPGIYADAVVKGTLDTAREIAFVENSDDTVTDVNYQFTKAEIGLKGRLRFRADLGLIYKKKGEDRLVGFAYPLCAGFCSREDREEISLGSIPLLNLPTTETLISGSIGNNLTVSAVETPGVNIFSSDGNKINDGYWELVGNAADVFELSPSFPLEDPWSEQRVSVISPEILEAGESYKIRLVYSSELGDLFRQTSDYDIIYNPPVGEANLFITLSNESVDLSWDEVPGAIEYWLYRDGNRVSIFPKNNDGLYSFTDEEADPSINYQYQVVAVSTGGVQYDAPTLNSLNNSLPIADAGEDIDVFSGAVVTLNGDGSADVEDDANDIPLDVYWRQIDSTEYAVTLSDENIVSPTFVAPEVDVEVILTFELTVTDSEEDMSIDDINVLVKPIDLEDGLVAYYPFDGDANDYSGNGHNGVENGGVTYSNGPIGRSVNFDGTSGFISSNEAPLLTDRISIATWVNPKLQRFDNYTNGGIVVNGGDYEIAITANTNTIRYALFEVTGTSAWTDTGIPINIDMWSHIVVTYDGSNVLTYLNGLEVHRGSYSGSMPETSYKLGVGGRYLSQGQSVPSDGWYSFFNGKIDDLRIYDRALSTEEITALFGFIDNEVTPNLTDITTFTFLDSDKFSEEWSTSTNSGCCGPGNPAEYIIDNGLLLTTNGGSSGFSGVSDGSSFKPINQELTTDFDVEIDFEELMREQSNGYKDNSGFDLNILNAANGELIAGVGIRGNYSGYFQDHEYNQYEGHRIQASFLGDDRLAILDELSLDELYRLKLRISKRGSVFELGYKLHNQNQWSTVSKNIPNIQTIIPRFSIGSGDGGNTFSNGSFQVKVYMFTIRRPEDKNFIVRPMQTVSIPYSVEGQRCEVDYGFGQRFDLESCEGVITNKYRKESVYRVRIFSDGTEKLAVGVSVVNEDNNWVGFWTGHSVTPTDNDSSQFQNNGKLYLSPSTRPNRYAWSNFRFIKPSLFANLGVSADNFVLEARIKNPVAEGGISCYDPGLAVLGKYGFSAHVQYMEEGCTYYSSIGAVKSFDRGRDTNLSSLGHDFSDWRTVKMLVNDNTVTAYIDDIELYSKQYEGSVGELHGIQLSFKGSGSVDWVRLKDTSGTLLYSNDFE